MRPKERADPTTRRAAHAARCRAAYANGRAAEGARSAHLISNDTPLLLPPQGKMRGRGAYKSRAAAAAAARKSPMDYRHHSAPRPVTVSAVRMYRQIEVTYANGIESFR